MPFEIEFGFFSEKKNQEFVKTNSRILCNSGVNVRLRLMIVKNDYALSISYNKSELKRYFKTVKLETKIEINNTIYILWEENPIDCRNLFYIKNIKEKKPYRLFSFRE